MMEKYKDWSKLSPEEFVKKMNKTGGKGFSDENKAGEIQNKQPE